MVLNGRKVRSVLKHRVWLRLYTLIRCITLFCNRHCLRFLTFNSTRILPRFASKLKQEKKCVLPKPKSWIMAAEPFHVNLPRYCQAMPMHYCFPNTSFILVRVAASANGSMSSIKFSLPWILEQYVADAENRDVNHKGEYGVVMLIHTWGAASSRAHKGFEFIFGSFKKNIGDKQKRANTGNMY